MGLPALDNDVSFVSEVMDLNDLEQQIYFHMLKEDCTVKDLVEITERTRSVVQRALQSLMEKNLIVREGRINKTVYYVYRSIPLDAVKKKVGEILTEWYNSAIRFLNMSD